MSDQAPPPKCHPREGSTGTPCTGCNSALATSACPPRARLLWRRHSSPPGGSSRRQETLCPSPSRTPSESHFPPFPNELLTALLCPQQQRTPFAYFCTHTLSLCMTVLYVIYATTYNVMLTYHVTAMTHVSRKPKEGVYVLFRFFMLCYVIMSIVQCDV